MMMIIIIIIIINFIKIIIVIIIIILDKIWAFPSRAGEPKYLYEKLSPLTWLPFQRNKWKASPVREPRGGGGGEGCHGYPRPCKFSSHRSN